MFEEIKMVQNGKVQATKFLREIVEAKKKPTSKDVENYVEIRGKAGGKEGIY